MKQSLFIKLAWSNLKKNARIYVPNVLSGSGLLASFYILLTLSTDQRIKQMPGGSYMGQILPLGVIVVGIMSFILILYTNGFLMKQRYREFGLYNVLGMEKRHVGRVCFWENTLSTMTILVFGLALGLLMYKLCALLICRLLGVETVLGLFYLNPFAILLSLILFACFYGFSYLISLGRIAKMKPVDLMATAHSGEKEPKIQWILLIIGLISLGAGYYISLSTRDSISAITAFFEAVLLVILGTYCLFITGSIALLKLLKNNKRYYYHPQHMISVSGLLYRMKANAVGLASISILATMVLVMISTTVSMYAGMEQTIREQYPEQMRVYAAMTDAHNQDVSIPEDTLLSMVESAAASYDQTLVNPKFQHFFAAGYVRSGGTISSNYDDAGSVEQYFCLTAKEYQALTGNTLTLAEDEVALCRFPSNVYTDYPSSITIDGYTHYVAETLTDFPIASEYSIVPCYGLVFASDEDLEEIYQSQLASYGDYASSYTTRLVFDVSDPDSMAQCYNDFTETLYLAFEEYMTSLDDFDTADFAYCGMTSSVRSVWEMAEYYRGLIGSLLFLGILLSVVFLFATALIIYYKQISEGYNDRQRFQIMQKVGMSDDEIRRAIKSQVVLIFFLPLLVAAMHVCFAFPLLIKLLSIVFHSPASLFMLCTAIALGLFALLYTVIYSATTKVYYRIVR